MKYTLSLSQIENIFKVDISKFYLLDKRYLCEACFFLGMLLLYFGSLHPWFLWPLKELYPIPAAFLLAVSCLLSNSMKHGIYNRKDFVFGIISYGVITYYMIINGGQNFNAYVTNIFSIYCIYILLKTDLAMLDRLATFVAKTFAVLLIPSIFFFLLYLIGFSLPCRDASFGDNHYSFTNYYFFMLDDRFLSMIIPRFQSVFLEPGHLGSATTVLLMTQLGQWKKWWNVVLIVASVISFSLAAYAILIALTFLGLWTRRKHFVKKVVLVSAFIVAVCTSATFYNGGDNLVNNLILARLEVDDRTGEMIGNNRVDEGFEKEFDKFINTSDVWFGRDMSKIANGTGNSGYRVFIYQYGYVGLILLILFYGSTFAGYTDFRCLILAVCISLLIFWIRGYPLWYSNYIPILISVYKNFNNRVGKRLLK